MGNIEPGERETRVAWEIASGVDMAAGAVRGAAVAGVVGGVVPIGGSADRERVAFTLQLVEE